VPDRYSADVESTVYFCSLVALENAARHAGAGARATARVWQEHDALRFEVEDDGAGFDQTVRRPGGGLTAISDRLGALGGHLTISSEPGAGTRIAGTIPLGSVS
jgi:signal transduction histidine kinase